MVPRGISLAELDAHDPHPRVAGKERRYLCLFPECRDHQGRGDNSLCVNTVTGLYCCHRCRAKGKLREYWDERIGLNERSRPSMSRKGGGRSSFRPTSPSKVRETTHTPILENAETIGVPIANAPGGIAYLKNRGIPLSVAELAGVRFCPTWGATDNWEGQPSVIFPLRGEDGRYIAAHGRATIESKVSKITRGPKSLALFETAAALGSPVIGICEAPIDALSLATCGLPAVAVIGTSLPYWLRRRVFGKHILIATDNDPPGKDDPPGERAAQEWTPILTMYGARVERLCPPRKDWNETLMANGVELVRSLLPLSGLDRAVTY